MTIETAADLAAQNMKTVYAWALSKTSDRNEAEELASEIIFASIENVATLKNDKAYYGWFWQIAKNTFCRFLTERDKCRKRFSEYDGDLVSKEIGIEEQMILNDEITKLRQEIAFLSKYHRVCTVEYYFNGRSVSEIAARYSLSHDMVKYYLFKTRKILKEGIAMERQFGEKSFNPTRFELVEIYSGNLSEEYRNLFHVRKLPGQILSAAYYEPMTMNELAFELGVPNVYLEDEMSVLMKYGFIRQHGKEGYQTNMFICDDLFLKMCFSKIEKNGSQMLKEIAQGIISKQKKYRGIGFVGCDLDTGLLAWDSAVLCVIDTISKFIFPDDAQKTTVNKDNIAIVHGTICPDDMEWDGGEGFCRFALSGRWYPDEENVFSYIRFPVNSKISEERVVYDRIKNMHDDPVHTPIPSFTGEEYNEITALFERERQLLEGFYGDAAAIAYEIAKERAPEGIFLNETMMTPIIAKVLFAAIFDSFNKNGIQYPNTDIAGIYGLR